MTHPTKPTKKYGWPAFWQKITWISIFLLPFGGVYLALRAFHQWWRQQHVYWAGVPVISVGNLTVGGNGKTPLTLHTAQELAKADPKRPLAVVLRGYGGSQTEPHCVTPADTAKKVGDEACLMVQAFQKIPQPAAPISVWVGEDRPRVVQAAEAAGARVILLDDGFQRDDVGRNLDIVVFDGKALFGNGFPLPAGPLREQRKALKRADFGVIFNAQNTDYIGLPCYRLTLEQDLSALKKGTPLVAFCGIGQPEKFFAQLSTNGQNLVEEIAFPDHHAYTKADFSRLEQAAKKHKAQLVTTEKDMVKLPAAFQKQVVAVPLHVEGDDWESVANEINKVLD